MLVSSGAQTTSGILAFFSGLQCSCQGRQDLTSAAPPLTCDCTVSQATLRLSRATLEQWLNRELDPARAFLTGKLKVKGNKMLPMKLAKVRV